MAKHRIGLTLAAILAAGPAAAADKITCPAEIKAVAAALAAPVEGWTARNDPVPTQLSGVTFYEGAPADGGSLAPDDEKRTKSKITSTWKLGALGPGPYWLGCRYAATTLTLERRLPAGIKECTVAYNATVSVDGLPEVEEISCK
jgi:hypothetical protein